MAAQRRMHGAQQDTNDQGGCLILFRQSTNYEGGMCSPRSSVRGLLIPKGEADAETSTTHIRAGRQRGWAGEPLPRACRNGAWGVGLEVRRPHKGSTHDHAAYSVVVVSQEEGRARGSAMRTCVPLPGLERIEKVPPAIAASSSRNRVPKCPA
jgi:hypothetical protein